MIPIPEGTLTSLALYAIRTSTLVAGSPIYGTGFSFTGIKVALIAALTVILYSTGGEPAAAPVGPVTFGAMAMREALIGLTLAFVMRTAMLAVKVSSEFIGHEMAFNMSSIVDPVTGVNVPLITQIYDWFFLIGFLMVDGHHFVLRALADSFERTPVGDVGISAGVADLTTRLFSEMFTAGLTFAAPIITLLVLTSVTIGLVARAVPNINILEMGFSLRILGGMVGMFAFAPLLAPVMSDLYEWIAEGLELVLATWEA